MGFTKVSHAWVSEGAVHGKRIPPKLPSSVAVTVGRQHSSSDAGQGKVGTTTNTTITAIKTTTTTNNDDYNNDNNHNNKDYNDYLETRHK